MSGYTECPNCVKEQLIVPLRAKGNSMVCPLCASMYEIQNKNSQRSKGDFILELKSDVTKLHTKEFRPISSIIHE